MARGIKEQILASYERLARDSHHRYRSWEHCFQALLGRSTGPLKASTRFAAHGPFTASTRAAPSSNDARLELPADSSRRWVARSGGALRSYLAPPQHVSAVSPRRIALGGRMVEHERAVGAASLQANDLRGRNGGESRILTTRSLNLLVEGSIPSGPHHFTRPTASRTYGRWQAMIADRNRTGLAFARTATFVALPLRRLSVPPLGALAAGWCSSLSLLPESSDHSREAPTRQRGGRRLLGRAA